jgi:endonuclease/exonuclease/phosphatase family metal-dependent hydrolase
MSAKKPDAVGSSRQPAMSAPATGSSAGEQPEYKPLSAEDKVEVRAAERVHEPEQLAARVEGNKTVTVSYWNCEYKNDADRKRLHIREVLDALNADVVLLQELPWVPDNFARRTLQTAGENLAHYRRDYIAIGNKEAALYFDPVTVAVQDVTALIEVPVEHGALNGRFTAGRVTENPELLRMDALALTNNAQSRAVLDCLMVSVHMPYKGYDDPHRQHNARWIIGAACTLGNRLSIPVIIGGDFNTVLTADIAGAALFGPNAFTLITTTTVDAAAYRGRVNVNQRERHLFRDRSTDGTALAHFSAEQQARLQAGGSSLDILAGCYTGGGTHTPHTLDVVFPIPRVSWCAAM